MFFCRLWFWTGLCLVYGIACTQPEAIVLIWAVGAKVLWWREAA